MVENITSDNQYKHPDLTTWKGQLVNAWHYLLFMLMGSGANWVFATALAQEIPHFENILPEQLCIATYMNATNNVGLLAMAAYIFYHQKIKPIPFEVSVPCLLVVSTFGCFFSSGVYGITAGGVSFMLYISCAIGGCVGALSSVIMNPFMTRFENQFISAGRSGGSSLIFITALLALIQDPGSDNQRFSTTVYLCIFGILMILPILAYWYIMRYEIGARPKQVNDEILNVEDAIHIQEAVEQEHHHHNRSSQHHRKSQEDLQDTYTAGQLNPLVTNTNTNSNSNTTETYSLTVDEGASKPSSYSPSIIRNTTAGRVDSTASTVKASVHAPYRGSVEVEEDRKPTSLFEIEHPEAKKNNKHTTVPNSHSKLQAVEEALHLDKIEEVASLYCLAPLENWFKSIIRYLIHEELHTKHPWLRATIPYMITVGWVNFNTWGIITAVMPFAMSNVSRGAGSENYAIAMQIAAFLLVCGDYSTTFLKLPIFPCIVLFTAFVFTIYVAAVSGVGFDKQAAPVIIVIIYSVERFLEAHVVTSIYRAIATNFPLKFRPLASRSVGIMDQCSTTIGAVLSTLVVSLLFSCSSGADDDAR